MIINSWKSTVFVACLPPFKMFIIGTGSLSGFTPPRYRYNGIPSASAAARAAAIDTLSVAFAPRLPLLSVPSVSTRMWSIRF